MLKLRFRLPHRLRCCVDLGAMLDPSWAMLGPCWGYVELCWDHSVKIGARLAHVGAMWGYGSLNGSILAHFEVLLGLCWPIWGLCWGQVRPSWAMLGLWLCYFHDVTFSPKFCLETLSPVACESYVWIVCRRFACLRPLHHGLRVSRFEHFRSHHQWPISPLEVNFGLRRAVLQPC